MATKNPRLKAVAERAGKDPWRSPLFHWLEKEHAKLAPALSGTRRDWGPVIAAATAAGVTDDKGSQPTRHTVWRTWRKVCQGLEDRSTRQTDKPPRKLQPRDLPATWRPTPIPSLPPDAPVAGGDATPKRQMTGKEMQVSLRKVLLERSGRTE